MNRRGFLRYGTGLAAAAACGPDWGRLAAAREAIPEEKMKRIGCTTTCFRMLFPSTRPKNHPKLGEDLRLTDVPALLAEKLGVHNVELWSRHFERLSSGYARQIGRAAEKAGSVITNVQLDGVPYNLSDRAPGERRKSINLVKIWMDRAALCGATSLRANTGGGRGEAFDVSVTGDSFGQLAEYGRGLGVKILVENHGGHSMRPQNVLAIIKHVDSPFCRALPDFGNVARGADRHEMLRMLFPHAHLASAKGQWFNDAMEHQPYDIGKCVRIGEACGFKGIYSAEYYDSKARPVDPFRVTRRIIELVAANL